MHCMTAKRVWSSYGVQVVGRDHFAKADVAADPEGVAAAIEGERRAPNSEYLTLDYLEFEKLGPRHPVTVAPRIITFLRGYPYKPSHATGRGPHPR